MGLFEFKQFENNVDALGIRKIVDGEDEICIFETDGIDDNLLEDFWRTKNNLIEIIAASILETVSERRKHYTNEYDDPTQRKTYYLMFFSDYYGDFGCGESIDKVLLNYSFEGYYVAPIIKAIYLKNQNNEIGEYFAPLMYFVGRNEWKDFKRDGKTYQLCAGKIKITNFEDKKGLFGTATAFCEPKLYDFYMDLIKKIEASESTKPNPFFVKQSVITTEEDRYHIKNVEKDDTLFSEIRISCKCKKEDLVNYLNSDKACVKLYIEG